MRLFRSKKEAAVEAPKKAYAMLAVGRRAKGFFLLLKSVENGTAQLLQVESPDGTAFSKTPTEVTLRSGISNEDISHCSMFRFSYSGKDTFLTYTKEVSGKTVFISALAVDAKTWRVVSESEAFIPAGPVVLSLDAIDSGVAYFGTEKILSAGVQKGSVRPYDIPRVPSWNFFDGRRFTVLGVERTKEGIAVCFGATTSGSIFHNTDSGVETFKVGAALFDSQDPSQLLWQAASPIAEFALQDGETYRSLGTASFAKDEISYLRIYGAVTAAGMATMQFVDIETSSLRKIHAPSKNFLARKAAENPIIEPSERHWENEGTFNPTAVVIDGTTHMIYRAVGSGGISRLGHAQSMDGIGFESLHDEPAFQIIKGNDKSDAIDKRFDPVLYPSGGSWGGCEDPRMTRISDRLYMTFNVFDGWDFIRIGLSSISVEDFKRQNWNWSMPQLISPPGEIHKNWTLFPEKIGGKFAILHSVSPKVEIAYRDSVDAIGVDEPFIHSPRGARTAGRRGFWDTRVRGTGGAPIKTPAGWLIFYHATDEYDPNKYKIGAMLLDLADPTQVIARSSSPLIVPDEWYENAGKPGIVYSCGAVERDGTTYVYYGGGDRVVCVALISTSELLDWLLTSNAPAGQVRTATLPLTYVCR